MLVSAYACAPGCGSELEIGWSWVRAIARAGHDVTVLTRAGYRVEIEAGLARDASNIRPSFTYVDPPDRIGRHLLMGRVGLQVHYWLWQRAAYRVARRLHRERPFERVHHLTWQAIRYSTRMGDLGVPFVFGPVGGGERAPISLRFGYGLRGCAADVGRDISNACLGFRPAMRRLFARADRIVATSAQSAELVPARWRAKTSVCLGIGCDGPALEVPREWSAGAREFLFAGRFLDWKGMHLGLAAFARALQRFPDMRLTLVGQGPSERRWKTLARRLGVYDATRWIRWIERPAFLSLMDEHDALFFPSLHDPGGMVVLEAMTRGLPVVCLDLGGPGTVVDSGSGCVVQTAGRTRRQVIDGLAAALITLAQDVETCARLSAGALDRTSVFEWRHVISDLYDYCGADR